MQQETPVVDRSCSSRRRRRRRKKKKEEAAAKAAKAAAAAPPPLAAVASHLAQSFSSVACCCVSLSTRLFFSYSFLNSVSLPCHHVPASHHDMVYIYVHGRRHIGQGGSQSR